MKKLLFFCCCFLSIIATGQTIDQPFVFPVKPGSKEWAALKTEDDRFKAMQIPDNILHRLSTPALIATCINFPAFGYITAYDNMQTGFEMILSKFNGLLELSKRKDAGKSFIEIYQSAGLKGFEGQHSNLDSNFWSIKFSYFEVLMSQNPLIESLDKQQKTDLLSIAQDKIKIKESSDFFSRSSISSSAFLMARVLQSLSDPNLESEKLKNEPLKNFINTSNLTDDKVLDKILEISSKYKETQK
jgi:hypothetical protein